ncbi:MAG: flavodoxin family protein [Clostridiales bacterium]|nr:flavodoxin family protein [Clostridiales bacterium]
MKITILYYSETGNTERAAETVRDGILSADENIEVSLMNIADEDRINKDFLNESSAVIFGTPCYVANMCWQMKKFFDTRFDCKLEGKLAACFATAGCMWGGADQAILTVLQHAMTRGMLAYSTGTEFGRPYIHLGPIAISKEIDEMSEMLFMFGNRVARKALELF